MDTEKNVFRASPETAPPKRSSTKKPGHSRKPLLIALALLVLVAAGLILYDTVGPGFVNYLVTFDTAGGEEIPAKRIKSGKLFELPVPVRQDYTFCAWTLDGQDVDLMFSTTEDVTLTARWLGNEYTVSFYSNGSEIVFPTVTLRTGDALALPESEPERPGYIFSGWMYEDGTAAADGDILPFGDRTLTAGWEYEDYTLTFDPAGGEEIAPVTYHIGDQFTLPDAKRGGYHLTGWFAGDGTEYKEGDYLPLGGLSLKASWERSTFRVSFESNGGSHVNSLTIGEGNPFRYPMAPWKDGYKFVAWLDENGNKVPDGTVIKSSMTVYAQWEVRKQEYTSNGYAIEYRDGVTYIDGTLIANKTYPLPNTYAPGGLTSDCNAAFNRMKEAAAKDGISLWIVSGYRSYSTQDTIYWRYVRNDGMAEADTYSARPGHSEHQTGLAMDINSLKSSFADTAEGKWLAAHCHEYGFIIRYPKGKQAITGYIYEPWHVRYLGVDLATQVYESGLTLEEYYGISSKYQIESAYVQYGKEN